MILVSGDITSGEITFASLDRKPSLTSGFITSSRSLRYEMLANLLRGARRYTKELLEATRQIVNLSHKDLHYP